MISSQKMFMVVTRVGIDPRVGLGVGLGFCRVTPPLLCLPCPSLNSPPPISPSRQLAAATRAPSRRWRRRGATMSSKMPAMGTRGGWTVRGRHRRFTIRQSGYPACTEQASIHPSERGAGALPPRAGLGQGRRVPARADGGRDGGAGLPGVPRPA